MSSSRSRNQPEFTSDLISPKRRRGISVATEVVEDFAFIA